MSELTISVLRLVFVLGLWLFVFAVVAVLRNDLFGSAVMQRGGGAAPARRQQGRRGTDTDTDEAAAPEPAPTTSSLLVTAGPLRGTSLVLGSMPVVIGRAPECTLVLDDDYASNRHARVVKRDDEHWVEDLGSTNGTQLNGAPLLSPTALRPGSVIRIGRTEIELRRGPR